MRINFGSLKGKKLHYAVDRRKNATRPTSGAVKATLFNLIRHNPLLVSAVDIRGARIADLCCGTGSVGFEFLSLGAASCSFFDEYYQNLYSISNNANRLGISEKINTKNISVTDPIFLSQIEIGQFDVIFIDPPYQSANNIFHSLFIKNNVKFFKSAALIITESDRAPELDGSAFTMIVQCYVRKDRILSFWSPNLQQNHELCSQQKPCCSVRAA